MTSAAGQTGQPHGPSSSADADASGPRRPHGLGHQTVGASAVATPVVLVAMLLLPYVFGARGLLASAVLGAALAWAVRAKAAPGRDAAARGLMLTGASVAFGLLLGFLRGA